MFGQSPQHVNSSIELNTDVLEVFFFGCFPGSVVLVERDGAWRMFAMIKHPRSWDDCFGTCQSDAMLTIHKSPTTVNGLQYHIFLTTLLVAWGLVLTFGNPLVDIPCPGLGFESPLDDEPLTVTALTGTSTIGVGGISKSLLERASSSLLPMTGFLRVSQRISPSSAAVMSHGIWQLRALRSVM